MTIPSPSKAPAAKEAAAFVARPAEAETTADVAAPASVPAPTEGIVRVISKSAGVVRDLEGVAAVAELKRAVRSRTTTVWVDLCGASPKLMTEIGTILALHPLLIEDLCERDQRAKLEQVGDLIHLVVFSLAYDGDAIYDRELDFVLGPRFLLSSHSHWWDPRTTRHLRTGVTDAFVLGPDFLLWALCDDAIDAYFPLMDRLGDEIDALEDAVVGRPDRALLERLFVLKRELIQIRRVTAPEREMFNSLSTRENTPIAPEHKLYFRDSYDHLIRLTDELDTYRELASATLDTYLTTVNNYLSEVMKRLTGVTVVVAGVGSIGGLFGMSEAQFAFRGDEGPGFWIVIVGALVLAAIMTVVLRKVRWI
jgi:magnesium transporter